MFGPVSGAHFDQVVGCIAGAVAANLMFSSGAELKKASTAESAEGRADRAGDLGVLAGGNHDDGRRRTGGR